MITLANVSVFMTESNKIEGIFRGPTIREVEATLEFLIRPRLELKILERLVAIYAPSHKLRRTVRYELLHPFSVGNGRSGRTLWAWCMLRRGDDPFTLPFLHRFYYQTLEHSA